MLHAVEESGCPRPSLLQSDKLKDSSVDAGSLLTVLRGAFLAVCLCVALAALQALWELKRRPALLEASCFMLGLLTGPKR